MSKTKKNTYILLGSNLGDREANLNSATIAIRESIGPVIANSSIYQTAPWGETKQPDFLNQVIEVSCSCEADELLKQLLQIEMSMGRKRIKKWGERNIDLDILFLDDLVIKTLELTIPHPGIPERKFTLIPLCEIASDFIHPQYQKTCLTLLHECLDTSVVKPYKN